MKILAFNGSPRLKGNSATMLEHAINGARAQGAEVELLPRPQNLWVAL